MSPARPACLLALLALAPLARADSASLYRDFVSPPDDARIMMRWWWFGPAVTDRELLREMRTMKSGGIGGFEVQPVYPLALDGNPPGLKNLRFLSPEFLDRLRFTAAQARELGLRMDLTLGSGWPYGGPMFTLAEAAGSLRVQNASVPAGEASVPLPALGEAESLIAAFLGPSAGAQASADTYRDFYRQVDIRGGAAWLPAGMKGPAPILFFVAGHTGQKVKRAAVGAEGYVLDHYSRAAVDKFIREVAQPELAACGPNVPYSTFCDSLEVFNTDWTGSLLDEFKRRRGYDLTPYLPALVADNGPKTADVRHDWGQTLTEVFGDNFVKPIEAWSAGHGTKFRIQAYGTPPAALSTYADAALPEGEGDGWRGFRTTRWASSASHLLGNPVTSSETWTWLHSPVFRATPLDMKAAADTYFLQGSNQLIGHGWPYTAEGIPYPGWRFYAAAVFDEKNPWWIVMPDVARYLQRVSFLLRQGDPVDDVAVYLPEPDAWSQFTAGHVALSTAVGRLLSPDLLPAILDSGHDLDFFDDGLLALRGGEEGGALAFGRLRYPVVVLPGIERMPLATLRELARFARDGGTLIATRRLPDAVPGFNATEADQAEFKALVRRLFTDPGAPGTFVASESQLGAAINARLEADVAFDAPQPSVGFVHRRTAGGEIYFLANTGNQPVHTQAKFRTRYLHPLWWNPVDGTRETPAADVSGNSVAVDLAPYQSMVLAFVPEPQHEWESYDAPATERADWSAGWSVRFGSAAPVPMARLASWTADPKTRNFSGVAAYEKTVTVDPALVGSGRLWLDLGAGKPLPAPGGFRGRFQAYFDAPVKEAAVVYVDGERAGSAWCPPYRVELTGKLKAGKNVIRIEVANLALNEMAAHPLPDYTALNAKYGVRFEAQEMNEVRAVPAGLFGPIRLLSTPDGR
ncbi:MAG TPA: glycosyl hydrolase [Opitutaceae bacterium]|nr:glycosyl hydrolase [Opitutaceae bacterium]